MYYYLLIIPVIALFTFLLIRNKTRGNMIIDETTEIMYKYGTYDKDNQILALKDETYHIIYFKVPRQAELIINSPKIWEVRSSFGQKLYDQTRILSNPGKKIVIIYPDVQPIKRYINENEMVFVKKTFFNQMYIIPIYELENLLAEVA